jgi:hypothetical protein
MSESAVQAAGAVAMCDNCKCRPVAAVRGKCGWDDWCAVCDESLYASREYIAECDRSHRPRHRRPPHLPFGRQGLVCPCGFFAIHNRPLALSGGKGNLPHMLVTIPVTHSLNVVVCLICDQLFKRHSSAVKHMREHHIHFHTHHDGGVVIQRTELPPPILDRSAK